MTGPVGAGSRNTLRDAPLWTWLALICILLVVAGIRFRLREVPLERDEGEYAYSGQLLLQGVAPWKFAYSMKLPGTAGAYAVLMAFFGQSCSGVHLGLLAVNGATIVLVFVLAYLMVGSVASWVAAATYALLSISGDALGTAGHATHFVVLPALAGMILLWRGSGSGTAAAYFCSGFLLGLCILMKQNGVLFAAFGAIWLAWAGYSRRIATGQFLKIWITFIVGAAAPILIMLLLLWKAGVLERFWFWTLDYARTYGMQNPGPELVWRRLIQRMPSAERVAFYVSLFGLAALWSKRELWPAAIFATGLFVFSMLAILPGFLFRPHYYILLMPVLALLTGAAVQLAAQFLGSSRARWLASAPILAFLLLLAEGVSRERKLFFHLSPLEACRSLYGLQPFPEAIAVGRYIREHSPTDARIAVVGSEPEIYFYARRRSATGYIYTYPLMERQRFAAQMRQEMQQEIAVSEPLFVVQVRTWTSWLARPGSSALIADACTALTPPQYECRGRADILPEEPRVEWRWGDEVSNAPTNASVSLLILQRTPSERQVH